MLPEWIPVQVGVGRYNPQTAQGAQQQQDFAQAVWHSCMLRCTDDHLTLTYGGRSEEQLIPS